jgi:chlorobactene glucosyltransferase
MIQNYLSQDLVLHLIYFQSVLFLIVVWNIYLSRRARRHPNPDEIPYVSILVPARNEEENITSCVESLLLQEYKRFEVIVLDDQSTDQTRLFLDKLSQQYPQLIVLDGETPPQGQTGKNWACSKLADRAKGELLFFTDADTIHHPESLRSVVASLQGEGVDLVTGFPRQDLGTWGERFLVPFFSWITLTFLPLGLAYRLATPHLSGAVGQLMCFRRDPYEKIGGHNESGSAIVDDLELVRNIKKSGYHWRVISIADRISCRMYHTNKQAWQGFVKNLFAAFDFRVIPYLFSFSWLLVMFWTPLILLLLKVLDLVPTIDLIQIGICIMLSLGIWLLPYLHLRFPFWLALFYPFTVLINAGAALRSLQAGITGTLQWKGRNLESNRLRLF